MDCRIAVCVSLAMATLFGANAVGQTVALPQPVAVVKDADGKVVGQVAGFGDVGNSPMLVLDFGGVPGLFIPRPWGLQTPQSGGGRSVYFAEPGCSGESAMYRPPDAGLEAWTNISFIVLGPDSSTGTYRVFRSIDEPYFTFFFNSRQDSGQDCVNQSSSQAGVVHAEEVSPNPLEGFHGPTPANPERTWTIEGGDRLQ